MKREDLKLLAADYKLFNLVCFANQLPKAEEINFTLNGFKFCAGYTTQKEVEKGGKIEISFSKYFDFTERQRREVLIHEMIHIWQQNVISSERYIVCTNSVAHDKVFKAKMGTINIVLEKKGFDLTISDVFSESCKLNVPPTKNPYNLVFMKDRYGDWFRVKVSQRYLQKYITEMKEYFSDDGGGMNDFFTDVYYITTNSPLTALDSFVRKFRPILPKDTNPESKKPIRQVLDDCEKTYIVKKGELVND